MDTRVATTMCFSINSRLDLEELRSLFESRGHVRIENFLSASSAEQLYYSLAREQGWKTYVVADSKALCTATGEVLSPEEDQQILQYAYNRARNDFASVYDANRMFGDDLLATERDTPICNTPTVLLFDKFTVSESFMHFAATITDLPEICRIEIQATRFRGGHFAMFNSARHASPSARKHRLTFHLNLCPAWRPDWGGSLSFRSRSGMVTEGYVPTFNSLDIFRVPQGHWITAVQPFVTDPRLGIVGRVYVR